MALKTPGLLVLTPLADAKGSDIEQAVVARRHIGPTLVVSPSGRPCRFRPSGTSRAGGRS
jgi:hypothetical protein